MEVICAIVILSSGGYRDWVELEGILIKESRDVYLVDFEKEFIKRKVDLELNTMAVRVNNNACHFKNSPKL